MDRELQLQLLQTPVKVTLKDLLRFKMYTLESKNRVIPNESIFGTLQILVNGQLTTPVHLRVYKDRVELDVRLLLGRIRRIGVQCNLSDVLACAIETEQWLGKPYGVYTAAEFNIIAKLGGCSNV